MLTPDTHITAPDLIRGGLSPWEGTIADLAETDPDRTWHRLDALIYAHAPISEDEEDDLTLADALARLAPHIDDLILAQRLLDDPNVSVTTPEGTPVADTPSPDATWDLLAAVAAATVGVRKAEAARTEAVQAAHAAGVPISQIAIAADNVSRQTIYRWVEGTQRAGRVNVSDTIDLGLAVVVAHGPAASADAAARRMGRGVQLTSKFAALKTGTANLRMSALSEEDRTAVSQANAVAAQAENLKRRYGKYPRSVTPSRRWAKPDEE